MQMVLFYASEAGREASAVEQVSAEGTSTAGDAAADLAGFSKRRRLSGRLEDALSQLQQLCDRLQPSSLQRLASIDPSSGWKARLCQVSAQGKCSRCGEELTSLPLSAAQREAMKAALLGAATSVSALQRAELLRFGKWVEGRDYRYVVDGPNVGYCNQNFKGGGFSFRQVDIVLEQLCKQSGGKPPLLLMPSAYLNDKEVPNHTKSNTGNDRELAAVWSCGLRGWYAQSANWAFSRAEARLLAHCRGLAGFKTEQSPPPQIAEPPHGAHPTAGDRREVSERNPPSRPGAHQSPHDMSPVSLLCRERRWRKRCSAQRPRWR